MVSLIYTPIYHYYGNSVHVSKEQIPTLLGCYIVLLAITTAYMVYTKKKDVKEYWGDTYWSKLENINTFLWFISMITLCITGLLIIFLLGSLIGNLIWSWII